MFVITGGGSGIGKALALALAKRGKSVLIIGRRDDFLRDTAAFSPLIDCLSADVATEEGRSTIQKYIDDLPQINALINNAGIITPLAPINEINTTDWHYTLSVNLDAALFLTQIVYKKLNGGRVLNVGSGAAYFAIKGWAAYCVSKAALAMLTQCWQLESETVAFANVKPGIIDTEMQSLARSGLCMDPEQMYFYQRLKNEGRLVTPETVAEFFAWLLLDVDKDTYCSKEWDLYDSEHHSAWLKPPHQVLHWDF